ncbi:MAG: hypothetical protein QOJ89_841 [bacterium]|jgi:hypothetical protein
MLADVERRERTLIAALVLMGCGSMIIALGAPQPLRALAAALILWAPGYALSALLLTPDTIGGVERVVISVATSVAITIVAAVLLDAASVRVGAASFLATGCAVTWVCAGTALLRAAPSLTAAHARLARWHPPAGASAAVFVLGLVLAGSLAVARLAPEPAGIHGSSALAATTAGPQAVRAQVVSDELARTTYRLEVTTDAGPAVLARFTLAPGASWRRLVELPAGQDSTELVLYRGDDQAPYRSIVVQGAPA